MRAWIVATTLAVAAGGTSAPATAPAAPAAPGAAAVAATPLHTAGTTYDVVDVIRDPGGATHVRLDRRYRGLRVVGGDLVAHLDPRGRLTDVTWAVPRAVATGTVPRVTAAHAAAAAALPGHAAELVVDARRTPPALAWLVGDAALVDASDGRVLDRWDPVRHADGTGHSHYNGTVPLRTTPANGGYVLRDPTRGGFTTRDGLHAARPLPAGPPVHETFPAFTDDDNRWGDGTTTNRATLAVDAHYAAAATWDYLRKVHRRNGLDGKGGTFTLIVHRGPENEAAWDERCDCATFGDGNRVTARPFVTLDVVGHELAHGVIAATARLGPTGEPGALAEATADIIGTLVEFFANNLKDRPDYAWGDGVFRDGSARWMDDPEKSGRRGCWHPGLASGDHYLAMGVGTHFFYLLAVGSGRSKWGDSPTCNRAPAVRGIGNAAAGAILYRALTVYMTSTTGYAAARVATLRAARDLYGARSTKYRAVAAAWRAVGVE